ncbi:fatty acid desaturase [Granulosicoccus antarcticus]|nr:fatty acid desaturase [Granulosicoccus antarcticus]
MTTNSKNWTTLLAPFRSADNTRALIEIMATVVPLVVLWLVLWTLLQVGTVLSSVAFVLLLIPAGGLMVRLFILQHDCGHGSMFKSKVVNNWVGRFLGVFTLTPYDYWRKLHAGHHATSGDLERRGVGDIDTLTVAEYKAKNKTGKLLYRLYRNPLVMFGLGPSYMFLLRHRIPVGAMKEGLTGWGSTLATNAGILIMTLLMIKFAGLDAFLLIQLPIVVLGASIGVWMFYVQHQYEETYWDTRPEWSHENGALQGSSYYDLPKPIMWITGYIGIHNVHHLSSRIPFYKLPNVIKAYPELKEIGYLNFWDSVKCVRLALWDENAKKLISFRDARRLQFASS